MATKLKEFDFKGRGRPANYPWGQWDDGSIWQARKGVDFQVEPSAFRAAIYSHAWSRGAKAYVNVDDSTVTFQIVR